MQKIIGLLKYIYIRLENTRHKTNILARQCRHVTNINFEPILQQIYQNTGQTFFGGKKSCDKKTPPLHPLKMELTNKSRHGKNDHNKFFLKKQKQFQVVTLAILISHLRCFKTYLGVLLKPV
ncbi:MAG: hypothetical protein DRR19_17585 [Candidatus Parabeggiatoa sp. nov. 1]|nr:MAG: hypothetical protein DRR19_17585 [Gammaproteobacteria bacterium]